MSEAAWNTGKPLKDLSELAPWDEAYTRHLIFELRKQVLVSAGSENQNAMAKLEELQQALWRVGVEQRMEKDGKSLVERARAALLELGSTNRQTDAILLHLVNRGILDTVILDRAPRKKTQNDGTG